MMDVNRRSILKLSAAVVVATTLPKGSFAQATSYTAEDLKGVLTPFGSLRAGNADGSIPAWTGGGLPGYTPGAPRPIPFADEKPILVITAANAPQYQAKLSVGMQTLFQKYPDFRIDVYPTHRTAIAPQYVYDYIYKNATDAQLLDDGNAITGAYGGIPFPIPKNGHELIWNHELTWVGTASYSIASTHTVTSTGQVVLETIGKGWFQYPYYFENGEANFNGIYEQVYVQPFAPPYEAGASIVQISPLNPVQTPVENWIYLTGERRVRRAPEFEFDTPTSLSGGTTNWDELQIFHGKLVEYDFDYVGTKEMFVPYNTNKTFAATTEEQYLPHFVNPDVVRWELHRVRVVQLTLKPGARNVDTSRTLYCDEDTGGALMGDVYDAQHEISKAFLSSPVIFPDVPCVHPSLFSTTYDFHAGDYSTNEDKNATTKPVWEIIPPKPANFFSPGQLAASSGVF